MKRLMLLLGIPLSALAAEVPPSPASEYADTEVSTNIPVVVNFDRMNRLDFTLSLVPSPSNCVEVAIGSDVDRDGDLSPDEAAYAFGCDCGCWFLRDTVKDQVEVEGGGVGGGGQWGKRGQSPKLRPVAVADVSQSPRYHLTFCYCLKPCGT